MWGEQEEASLHLDAWFAELKRSTDWNVLLRESCTRVSELHGELAFIGTTCWMLLRRDRALSPALLHLFGGLLPRPELRICTGLAPSASEGTGAGRCGCPARLQFCCRSNKQWHVGRQKILAGHVFSEHCKTCLTMPADPFGHTTKLLSLKDLLQAEVSREAHLAWSWCNAICLRWDNS